MREDDFYALTDEDSNYEYLAAGQLSSTAVPGFWIDVSWLWQETLPPTPACLRQILA